MGKFLYSSVAVLFALLLTVVQPVAAQDVVSASAGLLHYFEGVVSIDNKTMEHKAAVFPSLKNGSVIHTGKGRAELMLTPGVYLRMDEDSSLKMVDNSLTGTRLEMSDGSVILDNLNAESRNAVTLVYEGNSVSFPQPGIYRIDRFTGELQVFNGLAKVTRHPGSPSVDIDTMHLYYFALDLTMSKLGDGLTDEFYDWAKNRSDLIADQMQLASAEKQDAEDADGNSIAGLSGMPPLYGSVGPMPSPSLTPSPLYGYFSGVNTTPYQYPFTTPYFPTIILLRPIYLKPVASKWPGTATAGLRPVPVVNRWPHPVLTPLFVGSTTTMRYPAGSSYSPISHPSVYSVPRVGIPSSAPRVTAPAPRPAVVPHVGVIGHH